MNESETRREKIDPLLTAAGWGKVDGSKVHSEFHITAGRLMGMGRRGKQEIADYVLSYRGRKLAVVEAKSDEKGVTEGLAQAKQYAQMLGVRYTYATNGNVRGWIPAVRWPTSCRRRRATTWGPSRSRPARKSKTTPLPSSRRTPSARS